MPYPKRALYVSEDENMFIFMTLFWVDFSCREVPPVVPQTIEKKQVSWGDCVHMSGQPVKIHLLTNLMAKIRI